MRAARISGGAIVIVIVIVIERSLAHTCLLRHTATHSRRWRALTMYKTIVLAYDGSEPGQRALLDCQEIGQWSRSQLHLVAVMPLPVALIGGEAWAYSPGGDSDEKARYQEVLDQGVSRLRAAGLDVRGEVVTGTPIDEIVRVAQQVRADLIVLGHKHLESWAARWWRGSISKSLIEVAPCSVLVVITP